MSKKHNRVSTEPATVIAEAVEKTVKEDTIEEVNAIVDGVNSMLNLRTAPEKTEDNIITTIKKGTKIIVVNPKKSKGDWYRIRVVDTKQEGYAMKRYIKII